MILIVGTSTDRVTPFLLSKLEARGVPYSFVDEEYSKKYQFHRNNRLNYPETRIMGDSCEGTRPVSAVFVRHAVARSIAGEKTVRLAELQKQVNVMLNEAKCMVANLPSRGYSNYCKPYQVRLLADVGFETPKSLVTNIKEEVEQFWSACKERVIFKGVSNVTTFAQRLTKENWGRLEQIANCSVLFQEFIEGSDFRVHVVGERAFVTQLDTDSIDYRRTALIEERPVQIIPATLPQTLLDLCIGITKQMGLVISGIDFKLEATSGRYVALELNPYPQFTFYERHDQQSVTDAVIDCLLNHQPERETIFV